LQTKQNLIQAMPHRFLLGPPLLVAVLFSFCFILMQPHPSNPVSATKLHTQSTNYNQPELKVNPSPKPTAKPLITTPAIYNNVDVPATSPQPAGQPTTLQSTTKPKLDNLNQQNGGDDKGLLQPVRGLLDNLTIGH